jgi:hypothetical protein
MKPTVRPGGAEKSLLRFKWPSWHAGGGRLLGLAGELEAMRGVWEISPLLSL